jgi:hypothetical protein
MNTLLQAVTACSVSEIKRQHHHLYPYSDLAVQERLPVQLIHLIQGDVLIVSGSGMDVPLLERWWLSL